MATAQTQIQAVPVAQNGHRPEIVDDDSEIQPSRWQRWWRIFTEEGIHVGMNHKPQTTQARTATGLPSIPWAALAIMVVLAGLWWNAHVSKQNAEVAAAVQAATLNAKLDGLTQLVNAQNTQLTTMNQNVADANRKAEDAQQLAALAQDYVNTMRLEMARHGIVVKDLNK